MARARWTYELPLGAEGGRGIERFVVETSDGEREGTVAAVLERGGEVWLAVERGIPPAAHELRAVPWSRVAAVDPQEAAVRLDLTAAELAEALELDPAKKVEGRPAEARRLSRTPDVIPQRFAPVARGPSDSGLIVVSAALGFGSTFFFLAAVALLDARAPLAPVLVAIAAALGVFVASLWTLAIAYRSPYAQRRTPRNLRAGEVPSPPA